MMKIYTRKIINSIMTAAIAATMFTSQGFEVMATTSDEYQNQIDDMQKDISDLEKQKSDVKSQKDSAQSALNSVNGQISSITGAMGDLGEQIDSVNEELVGLLTAIDLIEDDIENKTEEIAETQTEYDAAVEEQNRQYEAMKIRIKYMYEQGDETYLSIFLQCASISDALNKADYVEQLYTYDREMLTRYQETVAYTKQVWDQLEEEKSELETSKQELESEQQELEEVEKELQGEYDNYDVLLAQAKSQAASYTSKINQQTAQIREIEKEEKAKQQEIDAKKKEQAEAKLKEEQAKAQAALDAGDVETASEIVESDDSSQNTTTTKKSSSTASVSGSGTGAQIASYGLQFVGNPYVAGGTSLTNGADCSGFVQAVYSHFGYSLPRTSYSQSTVGRAVSYDEAQAGDIIYYGGHVGIYIGNGQIVHASTERSGIKVSSATYRSIVTIRRVVN